MSEKDDTIKVEVGGAAWLTVFGSVTWLIGIVLASGFWSTLFALCFPPWAWYLTVERALQAIGWVP